MAGEKRDEKPVNKRKKNIQNYLEGNYDGDADQRYKQARADRLRSIGIPEEIKVVQEAIFESETERLSWEEKAVGERFSKLIKDYVEQDIYRQYLVNGAILRCTQAKTEDFEYGEDGKVILENKNDEVCCFKLDVHENPISESPIFINGLRYATVRDCLQGFNINPPRCNCRMATDRDAEIKKISDDADRNKNGVCRHLMNLNNHWDNFEVDGTVYMKKANAVVSLFPSGDGDRTIEGPGDVIGMEEGITMTSVLFCKHGGLIIPVTSGQENMLEEPENAGGFQFTKEQLSNCGWEDVTDEEVEKLNSAMTKFEVTSAESAFMLVATMLSETKCKNALEGPPEKKINSDADWERYKAEVKNNGNTIGNYGWRERGAGYIQLTGAETQQKFLNAIEVSIDNNQIPAEYIADNYPIEAAVYYWANENKTGKNSLNAYVMAYGANERIFLITQYFANGYVEGIDESLALIRQGADYEIDTAAKKLTVNGNTFRLPNGWVDRQKYWENAYEEMQKIN